MRHWSTAVGTRQRRDGRATNRRKDALSAGCMYIERVRLFDAETSRPSPPMSRGDDSYTGRGTMAARAEPITDGSGDNADFASRIHNTTCGYCMLVCCCPVSKFIATY